MSVNNVDGNQNQQFQIKTKSGNTDNQGNVTNAQTKQSVSIFSSYDGDKNENVDTQEAQKISIFNQKENSLKTRLEGYKLTGNAANDQNAIDRMNTAITSGIQDFKTKVDEYSYKVGKLVRDIMVTESDDVDSKKAQIINQGSAQLDSKVEIDATQKSNNYISQIEKAYKSALDEISKEYNKESNNVNNNNDDKAHSGHNGTELDNSETQQVEVFSDYDGNTDKKVSYSEIDSSTFRYSGTKNFGIDSSNSQYGKFLDTSSNYDVEAEFAKKAAKFNERVGSTKLKGNDTSKVQIAKAELNTKATNAAEQFNEEISLKVQKEKFDALDKAIKASQKDTSKFDNYLNQKDTNTPSPQNTGANIPPQRSANARGNNGSSGQNNDVWTKFAGGVFDSISSSLADNLLNAFGTNSGTPDASGGGTKTSNSSGDNKDDTNTETTYQIKSGDDLTKISSSTKVSIKDLYDKNPNAFLTAQQSGTYHEIKYQKGEADPRRLRSGTILNLS